MDTGVNFNASDLLATQAMTSGGRGYGGGTWGGGGYGAAPFAGPASNAVRIESGNRATAAGIENLLDQNQFAATNDNINDGHARICDRISGLEMRTTDQIVGVNKNIVDSEFRSIARENALRSEAAANNLASIQRDFDAALKSQECCCKLEGEIKAVEGRAIERSLNAANAELTALKTQIACGCCGS